MTKETIIKSTLKYLVKRQIEEGSVGFAVDNDHDHDCCWDDVLAWIEAQPCEDCRNCKKWNECPCGKEGHENGTSIGYSIGECKDYEPSEDCISREAVKKVLSNEVFELMKLHTVNPEDNPKADAMAHGVNWSLNTLMELPSVTPQTVTEFADKCKECGKIQNELSEDVVSRESVIKNIKGWFDKIELNPDILIDSIITLPSVIPQTACEDCISRQAVIDKATSWDTHFTDSERYVSLSDIMTLPSVKPQYTDEEIDKIQAVEQAYVDKMVELAVEESKQKWLNSFDTNSATKCFEAVNLLKQRLEGEE